MAPFLLASKIFIDGIVFTKITGYTVIKDNKHTEAAIKMAIFARWHDRAGVDEEVFKNWISFDHFAGIYHAKQLNGVCSTQDAEYLRKLIIRTVCDDWTGKLRSRFNTRAKLGEIIIFEGDVVGEVCTDKQPITKPTRILARIPAHEFVNMKYLKSDAESIDPRGTRYQEIADIIEKQEVKN